MKILSLESSCDDSALAYTDSNNAKLLWHTKISQENTHKIYGGVVPEIASRLFAKDLPFLLQKFKEHYDLRDIDCISVTNEPGLSTSLLEGVMMAKSLALSLQIPLLGINHLKGHIYSLFIDSQQDIFPLCVLLVSGGHTMILECYSYSDMRIIAQTLDDSFGECYDKAAKMLSLGYPGGIIIDSIAQKALQEDIKPLNFPIPLSNQNTLNFSFSGLKNAFRLKILECETLLKYIESANDLQNKLKKNLASSKNYTYTKDDITQEISMLFDTLTQQITSHSFCKSLALGLQESATTHLYQKCKKYFKQIPHIKHFAIVGGASANSMLRFKMQQLCNDFHKQLLVSDLQYCSDNAAMIGRATLAKIQENPKVLESNPLILDISARSTEFRI